MNIHSISKDHFWQILRENDGLFALTARAISRAFGIYCTYRQVKEKAESEPEKLSELRESLLDLAEKNLLKLMSSTDQNISLQATAFYLATKGALPEQPQSPVPDQRIREIVAQVIEEMQNNIP